MWTRAVAHAAYSMHLRLHPYIDRYYIRTFICFLFVALGYIHASLSLNLLSLMMALFLKFWHCPFRYWLCKRSLWPRLGQQSCKRCPVGRYQDAKGGPECKLCLGWSQNGDRKRSWNVSRAWGCEFFFSMEIPPWGAQTMPRHWDWDRFPFWPVVARQVTSTPRNCKVPHRADAKAINRSQRKIQSNKNIRRFFDGCVTCDKRKVGGDELPLPLRKNGCPSSCCHINIISTRD